MSWHLHKDFKVCSLLLPELNGIGPLSHWDSLVCRQPRDIILPGIQEDSREHTHLEVLRATRDREVYRWVGSQEWHSSHKGQ